MHDLKHRLLLALLATGMGAACGTLAGYLLGRVLTIEHTEIRLAQTAARTMAEADASSREARAATRCSASLRADRVRRPPAAAPGFWRAGASPSSSLAAKLRRRAWSGEFAAPASWTRKGAA